ncbi:MAG: hypothetical protein A3K10_05065 [Bacteroidetes bacterium RIFCSPLOWO2_12_FULL_31_6]|nr:MAG: hypothetical protein A3K10_05065 [Bacteroidetes bacterium RIFCSPLOWO2_12_FULL_31_6]
MIKQWLNSYKPLNKNDAQQSLREIMQEIALAGLYRANFFEKAAFYGGTALRIFYGLNRYSEDLDFSLLTTDLNFEMAPYLDAVLLEFESLGMKVSVRAKEKKISTAIDSTFLKTETYWRELILEKIVAANWQGEKVSIKIKLEVDTNPPLGFATEEKLLLKPFSCYIKCFSAPDLFAGKMHALLFRKWKNRVKGRDWFDLEWYIKQGIPINTKHLTIRAVQSKDWLLKKQINKEQLMKLLIHKTEQVKFEQIKEDVIRFIPDHNAIERWSSTYFLDLIKYLKVS